MIIKPIKFDTSFFFKNKSLEYCFYLLMMDGFERSARLGITKRHYYNEDIAVEWHSTVIDNILSDRDPKYDYLRTAAMDKCNQMYMRMVGEI